MRIFYITHTYSLAGGGGGEVFCANFLRGMSGRGHKISVFTTKSDDFSKEEKELGISTYKAPCFGHHALHKFQYALFFWKAVLLARKFKPDMIHAQNDAFAGFIAHTVKFFTHRPFVLGVEYLSDKAVSLNLKIVFWVNRILLPRLNYDKIVSWSDYVIQNFFIPWKIPQEKIELITGAIDTDAYSPKAKRHPSLERFKGRLIVSAKPLHSTNAEGISYVIKAMKIVAGKYPDWKYVVIGDGTARPMLEKLVSDSALQNNVIFLGGLPNDEIPQAYSSAEIVAHSFAFKATTSIALMESMSSGKAIVATDYGEVKNTVGKTAILVKPKNPESIAEGIISLIERPTLRKELGQKARERALENYSIKAIADRFDSLYKEIL